MAGRPAWTRLDDQVGINVSRPGWDAQAIEYPFVFDHDGQCHTLYNGNNHGASGFGVAIMDSTQ